MMKKNLKFTSIVVAALLAVAPVVGTTAGVTSSVVRADTQVSPFTARDVYQYFIAQACDGTTHQMIPGAFQDAYHIKLTSGNQNYSNYTGKLPVGTYQLSCILKIGRTSGFDQAETVPIETIHGEQIGAFSFKAGSQVGEGMINITFQMGPRGLVSNSVRTTDVDNSSIGDNNTTNQNKAVKKAKRAKRSKKHAKKHVRKHSKKRSKRARR